MLKKKSGTAFKPKARRNAPAASKGPERSATAEIPATTPTPAATSLADPATYSDQPTPTPELSHSKSPNVTPSTQVTEPLPEAVVPAPSSSTTTTNSTQTRPAADAEVIGRDDSQKESSTREPPTEEPDATEAQDSSAKAVQKAVPVSPATTHSTVVPVESDAAPIISPPSDKEPATPSSESSTKKSPHATASATEPSLDSTSGVDASATSTQPPAAPGPDTQQNPTARQPSQSSAARRSTLQATTPPTDAIADQPQPSIEAAGEPVNAGASAAPKPKRGRKRKSAVEEPTADGASAPKKRVRKKKSAPEAEVEAAQAGESSRATARKSQDSAEGRASNEAGEDGDGQQQQPKTNVRRRSVTPDDAEEIEVDIRKVKMGDLVKDMRIGRKFSRHDELLERERIKRQKSYAARKLKGSGLDSSTNSVSGSQPGSSAATPAPDQGEAPAVPREDQQPATALAPQLQIINGQIVLNSNSLQFDRHAHAAERAGEMEEMVEDDFTHHTTSSSYMKGKVKSNTWTTEETEKFYQALSMMGADFQIISKMFPGKTRRHIKLKFNREERLQPQRINAALVGQKTVAMDLDEYKSHTGEEYETVDAIKAEHQRAEDEFEAEQRRIDDEAAEEARRKREELYSVKDGEKDSDGHHGGGKRSRGRGRSKNFRR